MMADCTEVVVATFSKWLPDEGGGVDTCMRNPAAGFVDSQAHSGLAGESSDGLPASQLQA